MTPMEQCLFPHNTFLDAVEMMKDTKWNTIPVINSTGKLIGVYTRSSLHQMIMENVGHETPISDYIKKDVGTILEDVNTELLSTFIMKSRIGTGIVVNKQGEPIGLITKTDVVMNYVQETQFLKEKLEKVLFTSNLGAIMTDEDQNIIFANERIADYVGIQKNELLKHSLADIIPQIKTMEGDKEATFRMRFQSEHFIVRVSKYNISDDQQGFIILLQNVSELEHLTAELESEKKWKTILQSVINNAYDGLVMINEKEEIIFISPSLIELFDLTSDHVQRAQVENVLPQLQLEKVLQTGVAEISEFLEIKGIKYMVHRIPVYQDKVIIGAIGKVVYRQLHEVKELLKSFDNYETTKVKEKVETSRFTFDQIVTHDPLMEKLMRSGMKAAKGRTTILVRGESGTGKELFAHAIHSASLFGKGPFITVNCAAIPEHLLESEFFGYEEGAFTGAKHKGKIGKFDLAHGGTLFLDEVGDMSLQLQAKLLRVLQKREFYRVGGTERIKVDVRIIAATNRPLEKMVAEGEFREDLFYRLNVISFEIPPLRKRKKDILLLSELFIRELNKKNGTSVTGWDPMFEQAIVEYDWPGNVRELRNVWERAMVFAENGKVELGDLPDYIIKKAGYDLFLEDEESASDQPLLEKAEQLAIHRALQMANGNKSKACQLLGISRSVLYDKLKKYQSIT
ncbi:sigma 54-interacting transcriptional regulator [Bacillus sp. AGMB 02131]|uniref:Sigma 54-interacting transcriptional regulator n=2 Tax=Peribacillus faecalis TaxID=2772559 RepID=A0A927CWD2_9BACI|nr:sigma 54-interacting transcriptional regulator [Peribacillus faecalis]